MAWIFIFCIKKIANMKSFATLFAALLFPIILSAQSEETVKVPRLSKMDIGQSGCAAYFPEGMPDFELSKSEDGADVYTSDMEVDGFRFACITVKFTEPFTDSEPDELEELLIGYLEYLQTQFEITSSAGVGLGHTLESAPDARGVLDYWEDGEGTQYAVKGWINQKAIGIMISYGPGEYPHFNLQQMYLDSFRFGK